MTHSWCSESATWDVHSSRSNCSVRFPAANKPWPGHSFKCSRMEPKAAQRSQYATEDDVFKMQPDLVRALLAWFPVRIRFDSVCTCMSTRLGDVNRIKRKAARTASRSNNRTRNVPAAWWSSIDCWAGKDMEGSGRGIIWGPLPEFVWKDWGKPWKCQSVRDSNPAPLEYEGVITTWTRCSVCFAILMTMGRLFFSHDVCRMRLEDDE
jgi:hypothetical protein